MNTKSYLGILSTIILGTTIMVGCKSSEQPMRTPTHTPSPVITRASPSKTSTITHPSEPTMTASNTPTFFPTLPPEDALKAFLAIYINNGECEFPCFWGFVPGKTSWQHVYETLYTIGKISGPYARNNGVSLYDALFIVPKEIDPMRFVDPEFYVKNGVVVAISLSCNWIQESFDCTLAGFLKKFGQPEEIWIEPELIGAPDQYNYSIVLNYPTQGVGLSASGKSMVQGNLFTICPGEFKLGLGSPSMLIWMPNYDITFKNILGDLLGSIQNPDGHKNYILLEALTDSFDTTAFYETYLDPNTTACFDIDLNKIP
jgi:hypothetical protein